MSVADGLCYFSIDALDRIALSHQLSAISSYEILFDEQDDIDPATPRMTSLMATKAQLATRGPKI